MPQKSKRPRLGQNFLVNLQARAAITGALGDLSQRTVVEIGPGGGAITDLLAARARRLIAIELDRELAPLLRERFTGRQQVEIIEEDVLRVDFDALRVNGEKLAVVGNLPYYITTDILLRLFHFHTAIDRAVIMVQREVADRIAAVPGTRDYGMLSATAQMYAHIEKLLTLPPEAFSPPPEVHSTVLRLTIAPRFEELQIDPEKFQSFLRLCFAQKRKTLGKNLRAAGFEPTVIAKALETCGISPNARAEELPLEISAGLYRELKNAH
jgi:16S rRNA (adenine1518-N6/adenine1519-N6)-dimethyltransferase